MTKESAVAKYSPFGRERPGTPSNLIQVNFVNKSRFPENIMKLPDQATKLTVVRPEQRLAEIIEFPKQKRFTGTPADQRKPEIDQVEKPKQAGAYNPDKQKAELLKNLGILVRRRRRRSRCDGVHDAESDPCGSPRCKTKGRRKINQKPVDLNIEGQKTVKKALEGKRRK